MVQSRGARICHKSGAWNLLDNWQRPYVSQKRQRHDQICLRSSAGDGGIFGIIGWLETSRVPQLTCIWMSLPGASGLGNLTSVRLRLNQAHVRTQGWRWSCHFLWKLPSHEQPFVRWVKEGVKETGQQQSKELSGHDNDWQKRWGW